MPKKILLVSIAAFILLAGFFWLASTGSLRGIGDGTDKAATRPQFPHAQMTVTRADGKVFSFDAEVALGALQQAYGLMYVRKLPPDASMIFPYTPPQEVAFWMKNTYIPLDMLFIRADHTIGRIASNARPLNTTPIPSEIPVSAVIEINGGEAATDGIAVGDKVDSPALP